MFRIHLMVSDNEQFGRVRLQFGLQVPFDRRFEIPGYPAAAMEAWLGGLNRAFAFFGGVPQSILYDNDT